MGRFIMKRVLISMLIIFLVSVFAFSLMHILPGDPVRLVLGLSLIHIYRAHVIIGTTQHNSAVGELGTVRHGGSGMTYVGCLEGDVKRIHPVTDVFNSCGLMATCSDNVQKLIWDKRFTNVSASVLTAVLQVPLVYITENPDAWSLCRQLVHERCV